MTPTKIIGIILIVAGVAGLAMGGFSYTKDTHSAKIGPMQFSVTEKETVNVPIWAGIAAIAVGVALIVVPGRK
jgi:drug/metabolite transporter (DMT)-like permease